MIVNMALSLRNGPILFVGSSNPPCTTEENFDDKMSDCSSWGNTDLIDTKHAILSSEKQIVTDFDNLRNW